MGRAKEKKHTAKFEILEVCLTRYFFVPGIFLSSSISLASSVSVLNYLNKVLYNLLLIITVVEILSLVLSKLMYNVKVQNCFVKVRIKTNVLVFSLVTLVLRYIWVLFFYLSCWQII